jgi:hypothetical protein
MEKVQKTSNPEMLMLHLYLRVCFSNGLYPQCFQPKLSKYFLFLQCTACLAHRNVLITSPNNTVSLDKINTVTYLLNNTAPSVQATQCRMRYDDDHDWLLSKYVKGDSREYSKIDSTIRLETVRYSMNILTQSKGVQTRCLPNKSLET